MTDKKIIQGSGVPQSHLPFSPGLESGGFVFISGQASVDLTGNIVTETFEQECRRSFRNLERVLQGAGLGFEDVVQVRNYVGKQEYLVSFNEIYREFFHAPFPARTTLIGCLGDVLKFEVEAIARIRS